MDQIDRLLDLFNTRGTAQYGREAVSQAEHALQAAALAEADRAAPALVAAALLHDIGHLLAKRDMAAGDVDDRHEEIGWGYLKSAFGPAVAEPVALNLPLGAERPQENLTLELEGLDGPRWWPRSAPSASSSPTRRSPPRAGCRWRARG